MCVAYGLIADGDVVAGDSCLFLRAVRCLAEIYLRAAAGQSPARHKIEPALRLIAHGSIGASSVPNQLLALRRYLRIGPTRLLQNWSWTDREIASKKTLEPGRTLYQEAELAKRAFAAANPGYTLAMSEPRSLEKQVQLWTRNASVQAAGPRLLRVVEDELDDGRYPQDPDDPWASAFSTFLMKTHVFPEPTNAAPGTSDHGRGTAVDFVVKRGAVTVADTMVSQIPSVWVADGWERKLMDACRGTRLVGPLQNPYEPWHWVLGA